MGTSLWSPESRALGEWAGPAGPGLNCSDWGPREGEISKTQRELQESRRGDGCLLFCFFQTTVAPSLMPRESVFIHSFTRWFTVHGLSTSCGPGIHPFTLHILMAYWLLNTWLYPASQQATGQPEALTSWNFRLHFEITASS